MVQTSSQGATVTIEIQANPAVGTVVTDQAQVGGSNRHRESQVTPFVGSGGMGGGGAVSRQVMNKEYREIIAHALISRGQEMLMQLAAEAELADDEGFAIYTEAAATGALDDMASALDEEEGRDEDHDDGRESEEERRFEAERERERIIDERLAEEGWSR